MKTDSEILISYEIKVPGIRSTQEKVDNIIIQLSEKIKENDFIQFINIPEIIEENWKGDSYYRSVDVVSLGDKIQKVTQKEIIINKIVGHIEKDIFQDFLRETKEKGIQNIVLVGPTNDAFSYPGPSIPEANNEAANSGIIVGNICIPDRNNEADRMFKKTECGCSFFTTQVLFEEENMNNVLKEYDKLCKENRIKPARIFLCFATIADEYDIDFFKWLGVVIPEKTEQELRESTDMNEYSIKKLRETYENNLKFKKENKIEVPLGLNIAQVSIHNFDISFKLARELFQVKL